MEIGNAVKSKGVDAYIVTDAPFNYAEECYGKLFPKERQNIDEGAKAAAQMLLPLEPKLVYGKGDLLLRIAPDSLAVGVDGDVRDVICVRSQEDWSIGISCKHNHEALKHPRITEGKDFGKDWMGIDCSDDFMGEITPITDSLVDYGIKGIEWNTIANKHDDYYVPILLAYAREIQRMCSVDPSTPSKLLSYFFGAQDFYKAIMHSGGRTTTLVGFNMHGALGSSCGGVKPITRIPTTHMPTTLLTTSLKRNSKTTIILYFDDGWTVSMRLHNKDRVATPTSLSWDVQLIGHPQSTYANTMPWY